jgi:hypothetical protein
VIDGCMKHNFWADCDYSGCYPTCLSLVPQIDVKGEVREYRATYCLDSEAERLLLHEGVTRRMVRTLKRKLRASEAKFLKKLAGMKNRRLAKQIRVICERYDNTLLDEIVERSKNLQPGEGVIPAFFKLWFSFPETALYPCLPMLDESYGLVFPYEGETCVPASEVVLAIEAGAEIRCLWSVELPVIKGDDGKPVLFLQNHLRTLANERAAYKADKKNPNAKIFEKLLKEFSNSFYGKFAQGINAKNATDAHGRSQRMPPSAVTEPCVAALTTSLARAALSAALIAIERFNRGRDPLDQINIASCTTDGFLIGIPATEEFSVQGDYYQYVTTVDKKTGEQKSELGFANVPSFTELLTRFGCDGLLDYFDELLPLRQMRQARIDLVEADDYIEIKHMADYLISVKTRGQLGFLNTGECTIIARFGIKVPLSDLYENREEYKEIMTAGGYVRNSVDADWIIQKIEEGNKGGEIGTYNHITLESFTSIIESENTKDLTKKESARRLNTGFDYKRRLVWDDKDKGIVSPFSVPHRTINDMRKMRQTSEKIRQQGMNAVPEKVLNQFAVREQTVRYRNGVEATLVREFLRYLFSGQVDATIPETNQKTADLLNSVWQEFGYDTGKKQQWAYSDINNAKRPRAVQPGVFDPEPALIDLSERLADAFVIDRGLIRQQLFTSDLFLYYLSPIARDVVTAILNGPRLDIEPFPAFSEAGILPARSRLIDLFGHLVSDIDRIPYHLFPSTREPSDRQMVHGLFKRAGLDSAAAKEATTSIIPVVEREMKKGTNPARKKCLESFVKGLYQPDVIDATPKSRLILNRLERFGLTKSIFYRVKSEKFVGRTLRKSRENRDQIWQMARALSLPPEPFFEALMQ